MRERSIRADELAGQFQVAERSNAALVEFLISRGHPVDLVDPRYNATPLGYAIHDCILERGHPEGDFVRVIELLLKAGGPWDPSIYPTGDAGIDEALARFGQIRA